MAWTFRKRIKIAPGVHLNLSKGGVSTSIGPKGAKVNIGPKGTYLTTGIPGTGIYNRRKIGSSDSIDTSSSDRQSIIDSNNRLMPSTNDNKECSYSYFWILFILFIILFAIFSFLFVSSKDAAESYEIAYQTAESALATGRQQETDVNVINLLENDLKKNQTELEQAEHDVSKYSIYLILLGVFTCFWGWCLIRMHKHDSNSISALSDKMPSSNKASKYALQNLERVSDLRKRVDTESNTYKKRVLEDELAQLLQEDIKFRINPAIDELKRKLAKSSKEDFQSALDSLNQEKERLQQEIQNLRYDVLAELSDDETEAYSAFCESYAAIKNSSKTWTIVSQKSNTEAKSSASTLVDRKEFRFLSGHFKEFDIPYQVPKIPLGLYHNLYFYPRFVIEEKSSSDYNVIPLTLLSLDYRGSRFQEDGPIPADAEKVGSTYMYVNKNGGPDRRFSYNPEIPIMLYGNLTLAPYDLTYQISNNDAAIQFSASFLALKAAILKADTDNLASTGENPNITPIKIDKPEAYSNVLSDQDDRLIEAAKLVVTAQRASTSDLQRRMGLGYARSARIMDQLEFLGIVGPQNNSAPREVLVDNLDELDRILVNLAPAPKDDTIPEQYFYDVLSASQRLHEFGRKLASDEAFCKVMGETISGDVTMNGKVLTDSSEKIDVYLYADVIHSYTGLGHQIDLNTREGFGLMIFGAVMLDQTMPLQYEHIDLYRQSVQAPAQKMLSDMYESTKGNPDIFVLEVCLKEYDEQLHNQYVVLLYRFASLIAKADKTVSTGEAEGLNRIMQLKTGIESPKEIKPDVEPSKKRKSSGRQSSRASKELESLVGLASVKSEIKSLTNYIKVQKMRQDKGMKATPVSYHCVFTGNPGTGKTTVARIVSEIYKELGILSKGHLVETDRSGLVAEYVGQTAVKTNKIIDSALDGILFIDEAYSLVDGGNSDYGKEAISTLLKRMEDDRDHLVVILAGYTDDMKRFIDSNPGLQSRFNRYIEFPDYSSDELFEIFLSSARKYDYTLTDEAKAVLKEVLEKAVAAKDKNFGNGRFVRNLFEKVVEHQANRLSAEADVTADSLASIEADDITKSL